MADMVAPGKTHNIIGTKLWNMQYGGWLLRVVPGGGLGQSPFIEGRLISLSLRGPPDLRGQAWRRVEWWVGAAGTQT